MNSNELKTHIIYYVNHARELPGLQTGLRMNPNELKTHIIYYVNHARELPGLQTGQKD
jgi:hypothetical protein